MSNGAHLLKMCIFPLGYNTFLTHSSISETVCSPMCQCLLDAFYFILALYFILYYFDTRKHDDKFTRVICWIIVIRKTIK